MAELCDSRLDWVSEEPPRNTSLADPLDLLQGYGAVALSGLVAPADEAVSRAGRVTLDVGSRRFVARNGFRNTINGFTGVDAEWQLPGGEQARIFAVWPVRRLPNDDASLGRNAFEADRESTGQLLWAVGYGAALAPAALRAEAYVFGLYERDTEGVPTQNARSGWGALAPGAPCGKSGLSATSVKASSCASPTPKLRLSTGAFWCGETCRKPLAIAAALRGIRVHGRCIEGVFPIPVRTT